MYNKEQIDSEFMKTHGFRKKGTAFFRVLASKILQVVKTEKGRGGAEIQFGVFSLYSELLPQWLTSSGCIPRYHVIAFLGRRSVLSLDPSGRVEIIGMKEQLDIFYQKAVPWLDSIITQEQLCDGQLIMDTCAGGNYRWNDMLKFAPFLKIRDWQCAEMVLPAILEQHGFTVSTLQVDATLSPRQFDAEKTDHVHCEICWAKFSKRPEDLHFGYYEEKSNSWICEECFQSFGALFHWQLK